MNNEQKLNEQAKEQQRSLSKLYDRVSQMSDRVATLEGDIAYFKKEVSGDVKAIVEHLKKNK